MKRLALASVVLGCGIAAGVFACVGSDAPPAAPPIDEAGTPPGTPPPPTTPPSGDSGTDAKGDYQEIATGQKFPTTLVVLGDTLYWTNAGGSSSGCTDSPDGAVMSTKTDGSTLAAPKTVATGLKCPTGLAVTADKIYWTERGTPTGGASGKPFGDGALKRANHDGSSPETITENIQFPITVRVQGDRAFYFTGPGNGPNEMWKIALLPSSTPLRIAPVGPSGSGLGTDTSFLYWTEDNGKVWKLSVDADGGDDGGSKVLVSGNETLPTNPVSANGALYWFNHAGNGTIVRYDGARTELATGFAPTKGGRQLAVDDKNVYYTSVTSNPGRVPIGGGTVTSLPGTIDDTVGLALDDDAAYVSAGGATATIYRIRK